MNCIIPSIKDSEIGTEVGDQTYPTEEMAAEWAKQRSNKKLEAPKLRQELKDRLRIECKLA